MLQIFVFLNEQNLLKVKKQNFVLKYINMDINNPKFYADFKVEKIILIDFRWPEKKFTWALFSVFFIFLN